MARFTDGGGRTGRAAELDRAERMYQAVLGEQRGNGRAGSGGLSRRVVFAAAGATFLSAASACSAAGTVNTAHHSGAGPLATTPDGSGSAGPTTTAAGTPGPGRSRGAAGAGTPSAHGSSREGVGAPTDPFTDATGAPTSAPPPAGPNVANGGPQVNGSQVQSKPQYYVDAGPKVIALTLDDGPSRYTPQILEILAQYKVIATFCMIGRQVPGSASLVREVAAAGHHVTNHTWDHADQSRLSLGAVTAELDRTNQALADVGITPTMYRAPYGSWSPTVFEAAAAAGLRPLDWSVDPRDWSNPGVQSIVSNILRHTDSGKIILDHDGGGNRAQTVAAMRIWLPRLLDDGYRFTTP